MVKVYISRKFETEKRYVIEVLFKWILRIDFEIGFQKSKNYLIVLPNGNRIEVIDQFFVDKEEKNYLTEVALPQDIKYGWNEFLTEKDVPILYGDEKVETMETGGNSRIILHSDIFAASFFMLTRLEEIIAIKLDEHQRIIGKNSLAYKYNFLNRPIVNEFAEMLWNMILSLGYDEKLRNPVGYKIIPTHDVDKIYYEFKCVNFIADIFLDKNPKRAIKRLTLPRKNYWDTFSWLMDQSEKNNLTSIFYFMADSKHKLDDRYSMKDDFIKEKIELIKKRGHKIGIHPGYDTMLNKDEWLRQKVSLEEEFDLKIEESRQHYLRFKIPDTLSFIESTGIKVDSSLGYSDVVGFRCGTSCEFPLFDITNRKMLNVLERPLIIMETVLRDRRNPEASALKAIELIESYKETCRKYKIPLTILFHTNSFDPIRWYGWKDAYANHFLV